MELDRLIDNANTRPALRIHQQIAFGQSAARGRQAKQAGKLSIRSHGDQVTASHNPVAKQCDLGRGERHFSQYNNIILVQHTRRDVGDIRNHEGVQTFCA